MNASPRRSGVARESGVAPPKIGAHVFLWASDSTPAELDAAIEGARALGLDFVQVSLSSLDDIDIATTRSSLERHGMSCLAGLAVPPTVWAKRRDDELRKYLKRAIDAATELGSTALSGALYTPMGERGGPSQRRDDLELVQLVLKEAAAYAASLHIQLGLEPLNRYETSLVNTCEQMVDLISEIDEPNVFIQLDTFHMNIEEQDLYAAFMLAGENLGYVQLAESDRGVPGDGHVPWDAVFRGLRDLDYRGPIAFESFTSENRALAAASCLWRDVVGDPNHFVARGLQQLRAAAQLVGYVM